MVRAYITPFVTLLLFSIGPTKGVTIEEVQQHGSSSDCWSVIYDTVYDFTEYGSSHTYGGGPDRVWSSCGVDYTDDFDRVHGDSIHYLQWDGIVEIGALSLTEPSPTEAPTLAPPPTDVPTPAPQTVEPTSASTTPEPSPSPATGTNTATQPTPQPVTTPETTQAPIIPDTTASPPTIASTTSKPETKPEISMDELSNHDNPEDCWVLFYDQVYDLTEYAYRHPTVGEAAIHPYCGINGTDAFANVHEKTYLDRIDDLNVGTILEATDSTAPPTEPPQATIISDDEVAAHDTPQDCWVVYYNSVYDMTDYAVAHPGPGAEAIHPWCGLDATTAFDAFHPISYLSKIQYTKVADLSTSSAAKKSIFFIAALGFVSFMTVC